SPRRPAMERPAPAQTAAAQPDRTSPSHRKPLYEGAQGRRERMKAAKAPVWRTRLFLAMIAGVLIWGTITISTGHRGGKGHDPAAGTEEAPPFETDIQLGELGDAPGFGPAKSGIGLDADFSDEHIHMEEMKPATTATVEIAPPLQNGGNQTGPDFAPFAEPAREDEASYPPTQVSGRSTSPTMPVGTPAISSADLLGSGGSTEYVASRPGEEAGRAPTSGGSMYGAGGNTTQVQYGTPAPTNRSDANKDWWKEEPRGTAPVDSSPDGRPMFDQNSTQMTAPPTAQLGMPQPVAPAETGSRYGQQGLSSSDLFGPAPSGGQQKYYAPGDPAADRPAQARLDGYLVPTQDSRLR
ncbi:hypothetical protein LOC68_25730, partial [Blastopirellula sp. JC732]